MKGKRKDGTTSSKLGISSTRGGSAPAANQNFRNWPRGKTSGKKQQAAHDMTRSSGGKKDSPKNANLLHYRNVDSEHLLVPEQDGDEDHYYSEFASSSTLSTSACTSRNPATSSATTTSPVRKGARSCLRLGCVVFMFIQELLHFLRKVADAHMSVFRQMQTNTKAGLSVREQFAASGEMFRTFKRVPVTSLAKTVERVPESVQCPHGYFSPLQNYKFYARDKGVIVRAFARMLEAADRIMCAAVDAPYPLWNQQTGDVLGPECERTFRRLNARRRLHKLDGEDEGKKKEKGNRGHYSTPQQPKKGTTRSNA
ncbi:unnamed protein product, partial [Amoebophrya sp. A25]|eukprot:GSA25T00008990001.1